MTFGLTTVNQDPSVNLLNSGLSGNSSVLNPVFDQSFALNQANLNGAGTINQSLTAQNMERFGSGLGFLASQILKKMAPLESPYSQAEYSFFDLLSSGTESLTSALSVVDNKYSSLSSLIGPSIAGVTSLIGVLNALNQLSLKQKVDLKSSSSALESYQK